MQQVEGMEGLRKKTIYLEKLEDIEKKIKSLTTNMTAGGMRFFLLHLLYEIQCTNENFTDVETLVSEKKYTTDILEIDADVDYKEWSSNNEHWKLDVEAQRLPENKEFEPIEKTIWGVLDTLPPNGSDQYVEFSRTDYKLALQQILWSKCSNKQLYYALTKSIQNLRTTLLNIGDKQSKRELSLADGEKLYKGEELRFNFSEAAKVVADFKKWKSDHDDDEETIKRYLEGKKLSELLSFFKSGFLSSKLTLQSEIDFTSYKDEIDFERLRRICENIDVETHYSAMRELFTFSKGVLTPRKDKIGKYFFKHRKEVTGEHRVALFRFVKMLWLIEEEKKPKKKEEELNYEGIKIAMTSKYFPKCSAALTKKYNAEWLDSYMTALMDSKHKDAIATEWNIETTRRQVYCAILGALKDKGVYKSSYAALSKMIYDGNPKEETDEEKKKQMVTDLRTLEKYIGNGKKHIIGKWTATYEK